MTERIERRYAIDLDVSDGRTIVGRCVPYDETATVADPGGPPYLERIRPGSFRRFLRALGAGRIGTVRLVYEHGQTMGDVVGPAVELVERDDGLHGTFRALDGNLGDHGLELVRSGTCTGLSVTAAVHDSRVVDGVVERTRLSLEHVALTSSPAYSGALVTAVRSNGDGVVDLSDPPVLAAAVARNAELRARLTR